MTIIYYLPGHGGQLKTGLGLELMNRGFDIAGRETRDDFVKLPFQEQIDLVTEDLKDHFWNKDSMVIANSFGAYLFLHAQTQLPPFIGNVLLLSPIVGSFTREDDGFNFLPPRPTKLSELVNLGKMPIPENCEIHVGEHDWQSVPANVIKFADPLGIPVSVVPGESHMIDKEYVQGVLDRWLSTKGVNT